MKKVLIIVVLSFLANMAFAQSVVIDTLNGAESDTVQILRPAFIQVNYSELGGTSDGQGLLYGSVSSSASTTDWVQISMRNLTAYKQIDGILHASTDTSTISDGGTWWLQIDPTVGFFQQYRLVFTGTASDTTEVKTQFLR